MSDRNDEWKDEAAQAAQTDNSQAEAKKDESGGAVNAATAETRAEAGDVPAAGSEPTAQVSAVSEAAAEPGGEAGAAPAGASAGEAGDADAEREAKRQAAAEARAARAAAKAAEAGSEAGEAPAVRPARAPRQAAAGDGDAAQAAPKEPSPLQPKLEAAAALVRELVDADAIVEAYVNELGSHVPTIVVRSEHLRRTAELFKEHSSLFCEYLRNVSGVDYETHLETVYHLINIETGDQYTIKARTDRNDAVLDSVTPVWETANWNEREIYDLLGIRFEGHPDLRRIMMPDDWVGYPLRKDYEPLDPEV